MKFPEIGFLMPQNSPLFQMDDFSSITVWHMSRNFVNNGENVEVEILDFFMLKPKSGQAEAFFATR